MTLALDKLARQYLEAVAAKTSAAVALRQATEHHLRCCDNAASLRARLDEVLEDLDTGPSEAAVVVEEAVRLARVGEEMES